MQLGTTPRDFTLPDERSNYHHLIQDIVWFGLAFAATSRFLSVYALRLGATPLDLGLIASLPAIILLFSSSLGNWWMRRNPNLVRALRLPAFGFRLLFLLPAFAPFLPETWQPAWLVLSVALPAIPQGISSVTFIVMMRQSIDQRHMASLTSNRMLALNVAVGVAALAFGFWLEQAPFPISYQAMFVLAFAFALVSERHCLKVRPIWTPRPEDELASKDLPKPWRSPQFLRVAFIVIVSNIAFTSIIAITPIRLVEDLGATEGFMALFGLAELVAGATITLVTARIVQRIGVQAMIALAMIGTAVSAIIIGLASSLPLMLVAAALSGASWTAASVGAFTFFMSTTPPTGTGRFSIAYQQTAGLALFLGPMIGSTLVNGGANVALIILLGAGLRLLAGAAIEYGVFLRIGRTSRERLRGMVQVAK